MSPDAGLDFVVHLPENQVCEQDAEWFVLEQDGRRRNIRFHDYADIFAIPGLYEHLFHERLQCSSPQTVSELLVDATRESELQPGDLTVFDVGAGNGAVGEALANTGVAKIVGVDIIPEAADAARRDRPGVYRDYRVADLTSLDEEDEKYFGGLDFNCMTTVAALGFGDIPPRAFGTAFNFVRTGGLLAFNIKEDFLQDKDPSGFNRLVRRMFREGILSEPLAERRYRHRLAASGQPLHYLAYVCVKNSNIPDEWL